jgi:ferredoxin
MSTTGSLFDAFLGQHDAAAWARAVDAIAPSIHEVDRNATRIWFAFYPLELGHAVRRATGLLDLERQLWLQGRYRLADQIDTSHRFLYGHRYWPEVKKLVSEFASSGQPAASLDLVAQIRDFGGSAAAACGTDISLTLGITAVAVMTLQQVGLTAFEASAGAVTLDARTLRQRPEDVLNRRTRDEGQGIFGFLRGDRKEWTVTFDESRRDARFRLIHTQELTTAAAADKRDFRSADPRCHEGPIPTQCRSAFCGTCWVGVIGGADKLSPVEALERSRLREFGYGAEARSGAAEEERPLIRLACQARAHGPVSIVIPPWNGILGKFLRAERAALPEGAGAGSR